MAQKLVPVGEDEWMETGAETEYPVGNLMRCNPRAGPEVEMLQAGQQQRGKYRLGWVAGVLGRAIDLATGGFSKQCSPVTEGEESS